MNTNCELAEMGSRKKEDDYPWNEVNDKRIKIVEALNKGNVQNQGARNNRDGHFNIASHRNSRQKRYRNNHMEAKVAKRSIPAQTRTQQGLVSHSALEVKCSH